MTIFTNGLALGQTFVCIYKNVFYFSYQSVCILIIFHPVAVLEDLLPATT